MTASRTTETTPRRRGARTKGDEREHQILAVTRSLLAHRPMGEITIDEIASAAGISRTSFYFYFPSKQAVLTTLMEQVWDEFSRTHDWFDTTGPDPAGLRRQLEAVAEIWEANGPILACGTQAGPDFGYAPLHEFIDRARRRFVDRLAAKIERDRRAGLAPDGPPAAELATLVAIVRDGAMSAHGSLDTLTETISRMIYGRIDTDQSD